MATLVVEAVQFTRLGDHPAVEAAAESTTGYGIMTADKDRVLHEVGIGDWIVTDAGGAVFGVKDGVFQSKYGTLVEDGQ